MGGSAKRTLSRGNTVLALRPGTTDTYGKTLPSPVLYLGHVTLSGQPPSAVSSDAFKREVCDMEGTKHQLTDATIETCYEEVTDSDREELIERFWKAESAATRQR